MELFYAGIALLGFVVVGLVVDIGASLNTSSRADYVAQEAARAGAQQIDPGQAITGEAIVVDPDAARSAALAYLTAENVEGKVTVGGDGQTLTVTVRAVHRPLFSSLIGVGELPVTGRGSATLLHQAGG
ncbi:pilus assembly protein TadG-related protein [Streptomyces sp. NPDC058595]|uniref:pilus assembly protein TadG-related protein n=1 Tax=Streptomyces sp. NPDC058595 TaxID=3346550 RepID=UPI00365E7FDF